MNKSPGLHSTVLYNWFLHWWCSEQFNVQRKTDAPREVQPSDYNELSEGIKGVSIINMGSPTSLLVKRPRCGLEVVFPTSGFWLPFIGKHPAAVGVGLGDWELPPAPPSHWDSVSFFNSRFHIKA